jgi:phosphatidylglycerophosphate synthase
MTPSGARARPMHGPTARGTLSSIFVVAALTAGLGAALARHAGWNEKHIVASLFGYAVVGAIVAVAPGLRLGRRHFGLANQVTLLRSGLICLVGGVLLASGHTPSMGWSLPGLIAVALALDALDGWLARRLRLVSAFGARFDVEVDALLLLILALLVWQADRVGAWVLAIGLLRYGFAAAGFLYPWLRQPLAPSFRRKAVCVLQGLTLLFCLLPPVAVPVASVAAAFALVALVLSFATDVRWLARQSDAVPMTASDQA